MYFLCCLLHWFCIDTTVTGIDLLERTIKLLLLEVNDMCIFQSLSFNSLQAVMICVNAELSTGRVNLLCLVGGSKILEVCVKLLPTLNNFHVKLTRLGRVTISRQTGGPYMQNLMARMTGQENRPVDN